MDNFDSAPPAPRLPLILSIIALAGVVILLFLYFSQRSTTRELRAMVLNDQATAALNAGAGAQAGDLLEEVYRLDPGTPMIWRRRAIAYMVEGDNAAAIDAAKNQLDRTPGDSGMSALLGAAQILTRDYEGAEQTLTSALQFAPNQRDLVQNLSELRRLQDRPAEAAALLDGYLAQNPNDGFFQYKRAMADVAGDLGNERREEISETVAGGNATAGVYVVAAAIDFRDGKPDDARQKLEEANRRATPQDMRTMLEDEFFRDHIQFNPGTKNTPAPTS